MKDKQELINRVLKKYPVWPDGVNYINISTGIACMCIDRMYDYITNLEHIAARAELFKGAPERASNITIRHDVKFFINDEADHYSSVFHNGVWSIDLHEDTVKDIVIPRPTPEEMKMLEDSKPKELIQKAIEQYNGVWPHSVAGYSDTGDGEEVLLLVTVKPYDQPFKVGDIIDGFDARYDRNHYDRICNRAEFEAAKWQPTVGEECEYYYTEGCEWRKGVPHCEYKDGWIIVDSKDETPTICYSHQVRPIRFEWYENITDPVKCVVWDYSKHWRVLSICNYNKDAEYPFRGNARWKHAVPITDDMTLAEIEAIVQG